MVVAIIPSRYHSSRFPGKALISVGGEPLVARVARRVLQSQVAQRVLVATDHHEIARAARDAGAEVWLDAAAYRSGSDRVAAAVCARDVIVRGAGDPLWSAERSARDVTARGDTAMDVVLNVQGDEPMVSREHLEAAIAALEGNAMGTVAGPLAANAVQDPDTVKVTIDGDGRAVDFTRGASMGLAHLGIYAFTRDSLQRFAAMPTSPRERDEGLEQLRFVEAGCSIGVQVVQTRVVAINRPTDVPRVERLVCEQIQSTDLNH